MFHIRLCLPNIRGSRIEIQFEELWCLWTVFPQRWKKTGMLFLDLSQKKLILVVIQEKRKRERNVCVYTCTGGGASSNRSSILRNKWICFTHWKEPEISFKVLFWYSSEKQNTIHVLWLLRSRRNIIRWNEKTQKNQPCSLFASTVAEWVKWPHSGWEEPGLQVLFPLESKHCYPKPQYQGCLYAVSFDPKEKNSTDL